jgi:hypothetical protein
VLTIGRVSLVLLLGLATTACSNGFLFKKSQPPVSQREAPKTPTAPPDGSVSERVRDDAARGSRPEQPPAPPSLPTPARAPQPARAPEPTQAEPAAAPAEVAPIQDNAEPDPRAVIDWLLKDKR